MKWPDQTNPRPEDFRWGAGVRAGRKWDGTFYRDLTRYPAGGALFWSAYFQPGSGPGNQHGFWLNYGAGWSHLANDDCTQILTGASQRIYWAPGVAAPVPGALAGAAGVVAPVPGASASAGAAGTAATTPGHWQLVIEANLFVTGAVVNVWTGTKPTGTDPTGTYLRQSGCDPLAQLSIEPV